MRRQATLTYFILTLFLCCCSGNDTKEEERETLTGITTHFAHFPQKQFESLYLLQPKEKAEKNLFSQGYELKNGEVNHFKNTEQNIEVLLSGSKELTGIRVFFLSRDDISESKRLLKLLQIAATEKSVSTDFSYFRYETKKTVFSVNMFVQSDLIRLNIELIKPK